jgi:hypothetical protein
MINWLVRVSVDMEIPALSPVYQSFQDLLCPTYN